MKNNYIYGIIVVCIIILCAVASILTRNEIYNNILTGYWKSDTDFLEKNNISLFSIAIGPPVKSSRHIYILMNDMNNNVIINDNNTMKLTSKSWDPFSRKKLYNVSFENEIEDDVMPRALSMIFEPQNGFFTLYDKDIVYAEMYKDNELSDLEIEKNNNE